MLLAVATHARRYHRRIRIRVDAGVGVMVEVEGAGEATDTVSRPSPFQSSVTPALPTVVAMRVAAENGSVGSMHYWKLKFPCVPRNFFDGTTKAHREILISLSVSYTHRKIAISLSVSVELKGKY